MCRGEHCSPVEVISSRQQQGSAAEKNPTSKIQQSRRYLYEWDAHFCETEIALLPYNSELWQVRQKKILPYNSEFTANPEHGRTLFAPTDVADSFFCSVLVHISVQLCPFLIPHSSLLIPHSSFLIPHSSLLIPHSSLLIPHSSFLIPHSSLLIPHSSFLIPHSSLLT